MPTDRYNARESKPRSQTKGKPRAKYRLENDPRFLRRIEKARKSLRAGRGVRLENVK